MKEESIKFGVMCDTQKIQNWQLSAIKKLVAVKNVDCILIIFKEDRAYTLIEKVWRKFKLRNLFWLVYLFIIKNKFHSTQKVDFPGWLTNAEHMRCATITKGKFSEYFKKADVEKVKNHELDFILKFGFGKIHGEILSAAKFGIWSFRHSAEHKYGEPPCFWEIYNNDGVTGAILQKLIDKPDTSIVLKEGYLKTKYSYSKNREQLYTESSRWPVQLCIDIKNGQTEKFFAKPSKSNVPILYKPTNIEFIVFLYRSIYFRIKEMLKKLFYLDYWNIGIAAAEITDFLNEEKPNVEWFPLETKERFIADPFAVVDLNKNEKSGIHIFYETYPFKDNIGRIDYSWYKGSFNPGKSDIIDVKKHLSYPFLILHNDSVYMVPECFSNNNISIYKAKNFPYDWEKEATLIEDLEGVDSTITQHNGTWWLFTSDKSDGVHYNLKLFYSDNLFSGWQAHPKNPVKTDIRSARCAGTPFVYEGALIRPSMDYSEKVEGRIVLNRILKLTKTDFREISIKTIEPYINSNFNDKIHTLSSAGQYTIVDGCKEHFIFNDINFLKSKVKFLMDKLIR